MKLLHWTTLEPQGPSSIAAIRFSSPVIIQRLRVFGPKEQLFQNDPSIFSETEYPELHEEIVAAIRLFFTATPLSTETDKPKPSNQLASTTIHYDGGTRDFEINLDSHSTRLMILVTWLPRITVALYGRPLSETPILRPVSALTEDIRPTPLPPYLSFSQATSPTALASSLCSECVGDVSTFHILRLMFLLKPTDTDWELPNYPVKYADITSLPELVDGSVGDHVHPRQRWLEEIMDELRFPVHDDETKDTIQLLAEPLGIAFDDPNVIKPAWLLHAISNLNKHPPLVSDVAFAKVNLLKLIEADMQRGRALTERLLLCTANPAFAEHMREQATMDGLKALRDKEGESGKTLLDELITRVTGWTMLVQSLSKEDIDFSGVVHWIYEFLGDEDSFAMFIQGLAQYPAVSKTLQPVSETGRVLPLFTKCPVHVSLDDRKAFMRALVGIGSVLPVFCWANSEGRQWTLQKVIHAFLLWQTDAGYGDIMNRLLSLKQCIWRLFMTVKDCTQGTSLGAEKLLYNLYRSSTTVLFAPTFLDYLASRNNDWLPLSDDVWYAKATVIGQRKSEGVHVGVIQILLGAELESALDDENAAWLLRVLVDFLLREVEADRDEMIFKAMWDADPPLQGIVPRLVDYLSSLTSTLSRANFGVLRQGEMERLINLQVAFRDILLLVKRFASMFHPLSRVIDQLASTIVAFKIVHQQLIHASINQKPQLLEVAEQCNDALTSLTVAIKEDHFGASASARMMESLLLHSQYPKVDPATEFEQVSVVLDQLLPSNLEMQMDDDVSTSQRQLWNHRIIGQLPLFQRFLRRHAEQRPWWILRLMDIDNGEAGLEHFLLMEEVVQLQLALDRLQEVDPDHPLDYSLQYQVCTSFRCLVELVDKRGEIACLLTQGVLGDRMARCYSSMSSLRLHDGSSFLLAKHLIGNGPKGLRMPWLCSLLRAVRADGPAFPDVVGLLKISGPFSPTDVRMLAEEAGYTLDTISTRLSLARADAERITALLGWLSSNHKEALMPTLSLASYQRLKGLTQSALGEWPSALHTLETVIQFGDDEPMEASLHNVTLIAPHCLTPIQIKSLVDTQEQPRTPPRSAAHPALGLVTTSPPSVNRSPISTTHTLTKTYLNNDFRQLRNLARLNTSRPPSTHVDDFVGMSSPLGTRSAASQASHSAQSSPAAAHAPFNSLNFIPGLQ